MSEFSKEYGNALYALAKEENNSENILKEILTIDYLLKENEEYIRLIDTPAIPLCERLALIDAAFSSCSLYVKNFMKILCEKKSFYGFSKCVKEFSKMYDEDNNIERVQAITCVPLSSSQIERLKEKIEKAINKTVYVDNLIDKSILGGVILKLKNTQYDGSIKQKLDSLCAKIKGNVF